MSKKLISSLVAGLALSAAMSVQAAPMTFETGSITISFDSLLDQGTVGYQRSCTSVSDCNLAAPTTSSYGDDTWGVFSVAKIVSNVTGLPLWERGVTQATGMGSVLTGFFYGLQDYKVDFTGAPKAITSFSTGGYVDLYWNASQYLSTGTNTVNANNRTAFDQFNGVTSGVKAVSLAFNPSADASESGSFYRSQYTYTANGSGGSGYLDVVAGSGAASSADNNANTIDLATLMHYSDQWMDWPTQDPLGIYHDVALYTGFGPANNSQIAKGWNIAGTGHADSNIPEPASMALVGLGLMGLAGLRRRKAQA